MNFGPEFIVEHNPHALSLLSPLTRDMCVCVCVCAFTPHMPLFSKEVYHQKRK